MRESRRRDLEQNGLGEPGHGISRGQRRRPAKPVALAALAALASLTPGPVSAQWAAECVSFWQTMGAPYFDLDRTAELAGLRPLASEAMYSAGEQAVAECSRWNPAHKFEVGLLPVATITQVNTSYPRPQRDGLRWSGRGISAAAVAGAWFRWGPVSASLAPVVAASENAPYPILPVQRPGFSPWGSYYHNGTLDVPQRFGDEPLAWVDLGQSFVRVDGFGVAAGVSTETLRWGPARQNPLIMSGAAPGFPHAFVGTSHPIDVGIGRLEVRALWGRLDESPFFDTIPDNDHRLIAGLVTALTIENTGLTLGATRVYSRYIPPDGLPLDVIVFGPYAHVRENPGRGATDADNQLLSAFFRWALPVAGFEVYGEYARDDHWQNRRDLLMEPDHSRAYTIGLQKVFYDSVKAKGVRVAAEATNLNASPTWQSGRGQVHFYTHSQIRQGHTELGQYLGAPIGTGSDAQYLSVDYLMHAGTAGIQFQRVRYDNDVYYNYLATRYAFGAHDAEWTLAGRGAAFIGRAQLMAEWAYSVRYDRAFVGLGAGKAPLREDNVSFTFGLAWLPPGARNAPEMIAGARPGTP